MLSSYFENDIIVSKLIRLRCRLADKRADIMQQEDFVSFDKLERRQSEFTVDEAFIYSLFPPRKEWCHIGKKNRLNKDSVYRNTFKLTATYNKEKGKLNHPDWYKRLMKYVVEIRSLALNPIQKIPSPIVSVLFKKIDPKGIVECRPICKFKLKWKICLSLYNGIITRLLDEYFLPCSYAFRPPKNGDRYMFQHMNSICQIVDYRKKHIDRILFVAECDMQKFYDTINHSVIKDRFLMLMTKVREDGKISMSEYRIIKAWMLSYIGCFDFRKDVFLLNRKQDSHVWNKIKKKYPGYPVMIKWVPELEKRKNAKCGVPQGGALSGVIANIVMHYVDQHVVRSIGNSNVQYLRFCDDMVLIGTSESQVAKTLNSYNEAIRMAKLYPHKSEVIKYEDYKDFWNGKSRGPYKWGAPEKEVHPWITFVGFDINWKGQLRIRHKSYEKQLDKQHQIVWELLNYYKKHDANYSSNTIYSSIENRLIGMSVGRVNLWNYKTCPNIHSWASAYKILDKNPWSEKQLKGLDRHKMLELRKASHFLDHMNTPQKTKSTSDDINSRNKALFYMGKPFSYYGQLFKDF